MASKLFFNITLFHFLTFFLIASSESQKRECVPGAWTLANLLPDDRGMTCTPHADVPANETFKRIAQAATAAADINVTELTIISLDQFQGDNLIINRNDLAAFPRLTNLYIRAVGISDFEIHPSAFEAAPKLTRLSIINFELTNDSMIALRSLKNRLVLVQLWNALPREMVLATFAEFTSLKIVWMQSMAEYGGKSFPVAFFKNSAQTIEKITMLDCNLPTITSTMFKNMTNLRVLDWERSSITKIEPGAFDDLRNLERVNLERNRLSVLPNDLFKNNKNLTGVDVQWYKGPCVEKLTPANFTHLNDRANFALRNHCRS